jgi:hypothetical protein
MFGVRFAVDQIRRGAAGSAAELSTAMVAASGLGDLQRVIRERFLPQAHALQARRALADLRSLANRARDTMPAEAAELDRSIEQLEAAATEVAAIRLLHLVISDQTRLSDDEVTEVRALVVEGDDRRRLGLDPASTSEEVQQEALAAAGRWHTRSGDPLADPVTVEACELAARLFEQVYARAVSP